MRQARKNRLVYLVLAECRLIFPEAQAPQPDNDVHDGRAHNRGCAHHLLGKRVCPGCLWGSRRAANGPREPLQKDAEPKPNA